MSDALYLNYLNSTLQKLTPAARRMLKLLMNSGGQELTRRDIAQRMGKSYLMRYDIEVLNLLVKERFVVVRWQRLEDLYGKPSSYKGRNIALTSRFYTYKIDEAVEAALDQLTRKARQPVQKSIQAAPQQSPQKQSKTLYPSPWARLKDKLGL